MPETGVRSESGNVSFSAGTLVNRIFLRRKGGIERVIGGCPTGSTACSKKAGGIKRNLSQRGGARKEGWNTGRGEDLPRSELNQTGRPAKDTVTGRPRPLMIQKGPVGKAQGKGERKAKKTFYRGFFGARSFMTKSQTSVHSGKLNPCDLPKNRGWVGKPETKQNTKDNVGNGRLRRAD